jgi:hypothetical protein
MMSLKFFPFSESMWCDRPLNYSSFDDLRAESSDTIPTKLILQIPNVHLVDKGPNAKSATEGDNELSKSTIPSPIVIMARVQ